MRSQNETAFSKSFGSITWVVSALVTFVLLPTSYGLSIDRILAVATYYSFDEGFLSVVSLAWIALLAVLIFSVVRATLSAAVSAIGLYIMLRVSGRD